MNETPFWIKALFFSILGGAVYFNSKLERKNKTSEKTQVINPTVTAEKAVSSSAATTEKKKNGLQYLIDIPGIGSWVALIVGIVIPYILQIYAIPDEYRYEDYWTALFCAVFVIWNIGLQLIMKVRITIPFIPIPLWVVFLAWGCYDLYQTYLHGAQPGHMSK